MLLAALAVAAVASTPATTVHRYFAALGRGDARAVCRQLTPGSRDKLREFSDQVLHARHPSCQAAIGLLLRSSGGAALRRLAHARISRVAVHGSHAEVRVRGVNTPIALVRTGRSWLIKSEPTGEVG